MKHRMYQSIIRQKGMTLLLVLLLVIISVSTSLFFHQRLVSSTRISGATRDNSASLMLAESAMEMLRGGFINTKDSLPTGSAQDFCLDAGISVDSCEAYTVIRDMDNAVQLDANLSAANLGYIFYIGSTGIVQTSPHILQGVANGSGAASDAAFCAVSSRAISAVDCKLRINDLFGNSQSPMLYTTNDNGLLVVSTTDSWDAELARHGNNNTVAASWLELTVNPEEETAVDIWVEAAAQVGAATSFIQRYVGTYYASNRLGSLAALIEASNIDRRVQP